jgi:hypothetical protein
MPFCVSAATTDSQPTVEKLMYDNGKQLREITSYSFDENGNIISVEKITDEKEIREYLSKDINQQENIKIRENISSQNSGIQRMWGDQKVERTWTSSWRQHLRTVSGGPGGTVSASVNESFDTTLSVNCSVSAGVISAGIGRQVTSSVSVSQGYSHNVTPGQYGHINVSVNWNKDDFDVYQQNINNTWVYQGSGSYSYVTGAVFYYYE